MKVWERKGTHLHQLTRTSPVLELGSKEETDETQKKGKKN